MLENKKFYRWYAVSVLLIGGLIFAISLLTAMQGPSPAIRESERVLYFDRKILPDHVFYPVVVAVDRLELELTPREQQAAMRMAYAQKRLAASWSLFTAGKNDLAFATLNKAHAYLLAANTQVAAGEATAGDQTENISAVNQEFMDEYKTLKAYMTDSQQARAEVMIAELKTVGEHL
ncbi:hypothetical protein IJJ12_00710 [bacterium]|nr:hypothetical protein [bacterium]